MIRPLVVYLITLALTACGSPTSSGASPSTLSGSITTLAAASLTAAFRTMGADFEREHPGTAVQFDFAGSSTLVSQIQQGAQADVFASADQPNMQKLVAAGLVQPPLTFARNRLAIVVAAGNPKHIAGLADLARPGLIVVMCAAAVPCGHYGDQALQAANVSVRPASLETDVKSVVSKVSLGEADAGIVYVTDVKAAGPTVQGVSIPDSQNVVADYPIAVLKNSPNSSLAKAFVGYVLLNAQPGSHGGQLTLHQYGFLGP